MKLTKQIRTITFTCFLFLTPAIVQAQPVFESEDVEDVPVDGGLSLLVAAGAAYGAGRLKRKKGTLRK